MQLIFQYCGTLAQYAVGPLKGFCIGRLGRCAMSVLLGVLLCLSVPAWSDESCPTVKACEFAQRYAAVMREHGTEVMGGGLKVIDSRAEGTVVTTDVLGPGRLGHYSESKIEELRQINIQGLYKGFCRGPEAIAVLDKGIQLRMRIHSLDDILLVDHIIESCGELE